MDSPVRRCSSCHHAESFHGVNGCTCSDLGQGVSLVLFPCVCKKSILTIQVYESNTYEIPENKTKSALSSIRNQALMLATGCHVLAAYDENDFSKEEHNILVDMLQTARNTINGLLSREKLED